MLLIEYTLACSNNTECIHSVFMHTNVVKKFNKKYKHIRVLSKRYANVCDWVVVEVPGVIFMRCPASQSWASGRFFSRRVLLEFKYIFCYVRITLHSFCATRPDLHFNLIFPFAEPLAATGIISACLSKHHSASKSGVYAYVS